MNYYEACTAVVTKAQAIREIEKHSIDPDLFLEECGDHAEYDGQDALNWLGY